MWRFKRSAKYIHSNTDKLNELHNDYHYTGKSGVDETVGILPGRPSSGVAILFKKSLAHHINSIDVPIRRVCAINISDDSNCNTIVINVYCPCDNSSNANLNKEYEDVLNDVKSIFLSNNVDAVIIGGDFNTCFDRHNVQTRCLKEFYERNC